MENDPLLQQIAALKQSLIDEGIMDEHFIQLETITPKEEPYFVEETINLFYNETRKHIEDIEILMEKILTDYNEVHRRLIKLLGSCASVGASKARSEVDVTKEFCEHGNLEGAKVSLERVKTEIETFKEKIDSYCELVQQAKNAK